MVRTEPRRRKPWVSPWGLTMTAGKSPSSTSREGVSGDRPCPGGRVPWLPVLVDGPANQPGGSERWILVLMDPATVALYERHASEWSQRRGNATDGLGRRFRDQVGTGLIVDLGCGSGRYLPEIGPPLVGAGVTAALLCLARTQGFPLVRCYIEALPFADRGLAGAFAHHPYLHLVKVRIAPALA